MSDEIKNEDEVLENEKPEQIDDKEKLGAFVLKNVLLYWKRVVVMFAIVGGVVLLMSGYSCSYKGCSFSKTPAIIHNDKINQ